MNKELLNEFNPLSKINFETRYAIIVTIIMVVSAIVLVCLIIFGNISNEPDYTTFLTVSIVDGCIFIDIVSNILSPSEEYIKNNNLKKEE